MSIFNRSWKRFISINPLIYLIFGVVFGLICILSLRHNNQQMAQLRTAVYQTDKNAGDVQGALNNLQAYVTAHMNTNLLTGSGSVYPPIQLEYTYLRLAEAQNQTILQENSGLYTEAQNYCQKLDPVDFSGHNRVPCIEQYITSHGAKLATIPPELYEFDFVSPTWSPDLAGWSLVLTVLSFVLAALFYLRLIILKLTQR